MRRTARRIAAVAGVFLLTVIGSSSCSHRAEPTPASLLGVFPSSAVFPPRPETLGAPWVLWYGLGPSFWSRHSGFATAEECQSQVEAMRARLALTRALVQQALEQGPGFVPGVGGAVTSSAARSISPQIRGAFTPRFTCVANGVDPRTPPKNREDPAGSVTQS